MHNIRTMLRQHPLEALSLSPHPCNGFSALLSRFQGCRASFFAMARVRQKG